MQKTTEHGLAVHYAIEVTCGVRTWSVQRRFSQFWNLHTALGPHAPSAEGGIFSSSHEFGPVRAAVQNYYSPALIEARVRELDAWLGRTCSSNTYSLKLGSFLSLATPDVDAYKSLSRTPDPKPCVLCSCGVPCEFTEEVSAARRDFVPAHSYATAPDFSYDAYAKPEPNVHGGSGLALLHVLRDSLLLPPTPSPLTRTLSPDTVTDLITTCEPCCKVDEPDGWGATSRPKGGEAKVVAAVMRHSFCYEPTAAALAVELSKLHGWLACCGGKTHWLSAAEARRFVDHCCLVRGAAHGQPGRVLARFHPTLMVCALTYLKRLATIAEMPLVLGAREKKGKGDEGGARAAAAGEKGKEEERGPSQAELRQFKMLASFIEEDDWQVALLACLVLGTKTYSDFADSLVTNAVLCARRSGLREGWPLCTGARLRRAEHELLCLLDFRSTVLPAELFKVGPRCGWGSLA